MTKEQIQFRINEIRNKVEKLLTEEKELQSKLGEIVKDENTILLLNEIKEVNSVNTMTVHLTADTRTTPIMDEFYHSEKRFLMFWKIFSVGRYLTRVSLVVVRSRRNVHFCDSGMTMTDLKKQAGTAVNENILKYIPQDTRFYPIAKEMLAAMNKYSDGETQIPFDTPIRLGGQTYANQIGFGSTYDGTYQVTQGTLYGETTGFYIIGMIVA